MKFGFPVWYGDRPLKPMIEKIHRLGFDYIEFDLNSPWPESLAKEEMKILENLKDYYGLEIAFHGPLFGVDISHLIDRISEASLAVILDAIKFSEKFKPLYFNFHVSSYSNPHVLEFNDVRDIAYEKAGRNIGKIIEKSKIPLTLENNGTNPVFKTLEEFNTLKDYRLNFCLDVGHATKCKFHLGKSGVHVPWELKDWLDSFKDKILTAHLHDCLIKNNQIYDHVPIGSGIIDFNEVFDALKQTKCKHVLVEIFHPAEGILTEKQIKENLEFCRSGLC